MTYETEATPVCNECAAVREVESESPAATMARSPRSASFDSNAPSRPKGRNSEYSRSAPYKAPSKMIEARKIFGVFFNSSPGRMPCVKLAERGNNAPAQGTVSQWFSQSLEYSYHRNQVRK